MTQKDGYLAYDSKNYLFLDIKVNDIVERLEVGGLVPRKGWIAKWNWLKVLQLVARGSYQVAYTTSKSADKDGDIVIHVTPINNC